MKKSLRILSLFLGVSLFLPLTSCEEKEGGKIDLTDYTRAERFWTKGNEEENAAFTAFTKQIFQTAYQKDMLNLHFAVKDLDAYGIERPAMDLFAESEWDNEEILSALKGFDYQKLSRENQITYRVMEEDLTDALSWSELSDLESPFSYASGIQTELVTIATEYEFFVWQDVLDYLDLLSQIPEYFDSLYAEEEVRVEEGYGCSDLMLDKIVEQFENVYTEGEDSAFLSSFNEKIEAFPDVDEATKRELEEQNKALVMETVFPAYQKTAQALSAFYGKGVDGGLCEFGDEGKAYYEMLVKTKSGYGESVMSLFDELSDFFSTCYSELFTLLAKTGGSRQFSAWQEGDVVTPTDPEEILSFYSGHLDSLFPPIPDTSYSVKYLSENIAKTMPDILAYYLIPQIDNYQNGSITVNPYAGDEAGAMNTLCHEGYPGHFYQNVFFMSQNPDPVRTLFSFAGYTEGWAVYAANRAAYVYPYPSSASLYYHFDEINISSSYALYAMADIGVHYYGFDENKIAEQFGLPEESAAAVYEAVLLNPGAYLSYGAGNYQMYKLRSAARGYSGGTLNDVEFHTFLLKVGPCNFNLLFSLLEDYYVKKPTSQSSEGVLV